MPISLNLSELESYEPVQENITNMVKRKLQTTNKMVENCLIEMHNTKGVTLQQIYKFIMNNYDIESLSKIRINLIKKYIIKLRESEDIVNKTGRGFSGRIKLVDKQKFIQNIKTNKTQATRKGEASAKKAVEKEGNTETNIKNKTDNSKIKVVNRKVRKPPQIEQYRPIIPRQTTPALLHHNVSMFDTPMVASQVNSSTPAINAFVPRAPVVKKRSKRAILKPGDSGTPRSSLPKKKRKLATRLETVQ